MKKTAILLSGFSLGVLLILSVLTLRAQTTVMQCVPGNNRPNIGTCYTSNSSDNQKCVTPQNGDALDCAAAIAVTISKVNNGN